LLTHVEGLGTIVRTSSTVPWLYSMAVTERGLCYSW